MSDFFIPIVTQSEQNLREHWSVRAKRVRAQRIAARLLTASRPLPEGFKRGMPLLVTLTRCSPRSLDSHDNLRSSLKACVDGIADALGINDRDPSVKWEYSQVKSKTKGVRVKIEER